MKNTIWITGAGGKLGSVLTNHLKKDTDVKVIVTDNDVDITDPAAVDQAFKVYQPNVVINCASISDTAKCEQDPLAAYRVNTLGARNLAAASRAHNARMIQMSTDDVFCGKDAAPLTEFDTPNPENIYGKSKLAGENFVRELNPKHLIIRSSWVYGSDSGTGAKDYMDYVLEKAKSGTPFTAGTNNISTPTSAAELARAVTVLMDHNEYGIFHASCEGSCSRYEFAKAVLELTGNDVSLVSPESDSKPCCTLLSNLMMKMTGICEMSGWHDELERYIRENEVK